MLNFLIVFADLYLSRIPGYYRLAGFLSDFISPRIPYDSLLKKLNLGCSDKSLSGYLNVDARAEANPDIVGNVNQLTYAPDNSQDLIRASHVLEHFHPNETMAVLAEWYRALKPGGYLVVCVPDHIRLAWRSILAQKKLRFSHFDNGWMNGLFALDLPPEYRHQAVFTKDSLTELLYKSGFKDIESLHWRVEDPYRQGIDDNSCSPYSLNLVARKPPEVITKIQLPATHNTLLASL